MKRLLMLVSGPPHSSGYPSRSAGKVCPTAQVYFDVDRSVYFYCSSGEWHTVATLPVGIRIDVGERVTLDLATARPYEVHTYIVKNYPPARRRS